MVISYSEIISRKEITHCITQLNVKPTVILFSAFFFITNLLSNNFISLNSKYYIHSTD